MPKLKDYQNYLDDDNDGQVTEGKKYPNSNPKPRKKKENRNIDLSEKEDRRYR